MPPTDPETILPASLLCPSPLIGGTPPALPEDQVLGPGPASFFLFPQTMASWSPYEQKLLFSPPHQKQKKTETNN